MPAHVFSNHTFFLSITSVLIESSCSYVCTGMINGLPSLEEQEAVLRIGLHFKGS